MANRKALIVAINDYGGPPNDLPSCINDGNAFQRLLQNTYEFSEIRTLYDAQATAANVEKELAWLVKDVKSDDRVVFYYSGHGYTKLVDGVMSEFLVLLDGGKPALWLDDKLVAKTRGLSPGVFTAILDSCFSGGMFKMVFDSESPDQAEIAQAKVYQPPPEEQTKAFEGLVAKPQDGGAVRVQGYRRFGCGTASVMQTIAARARGTTGTSAATATKALSDPSEARDAEFSGLLVSACLETETAAASTSKTEGLSAFTHALVRTLTAVGARRSTAEVFQTTAKNLKQFGFRQTPLLLERATPGNLKNRTFINMEVRKASSEMEQNGVSLENNGLSDEDMQKFLPFLGAVLPSILSAAPGILNAIRRRHKEFEVDAEPAFSDEETQKWLGALIPAVLHVAPRIISAVRGRRKELGLEEEAAITDEEVQKIVGSLDFQSIWRNANIHAPVNPFLRPAVGPSGSPYGLPHPLRSRPSTSTSPNKTADLTDEEAQKWFGALLQVVTHAAPSIIGALRGRRKDFDLGYAGAADTDIADEKLFGAIMRVLPRVLRAAPGIVQAIGARRKDADLGGFDDGGQAEISDEKLFGAIFRVLPHVLRAAPGIVQAVAGRRKDFDFTDLAAE